MQLALESAWLLTQPLTAAGVHLDDGTFCYHAPVQIAGGIEWCAAGCRVTTRWLILEA